MNFPGRFTEVQRALYMAVLEVQEKCIDMCTSKYSLADIYKEMLELLGQHLIQLGILAKMDNKHHFTQVSGFLYHCDPLYFTYFSMKTCWPC